MLNAFMERRRHLESLTESLRQLVAVLRLDPGCQWRAHFESSLEEASQLLEKGFSQDDLSRFSTSVVYVFAGAGSFNDYALEAYDPVTGRCKQISGTDGFEELSNRVYDQALSLRAIGQVG